jgi:hypothetical protein
MRITHARQMEMDVRNRRMEKATVEYLTDRTNDDDGEKWATVSIY